MKLIFFTLFIFKTVSCFSQVDTFYWAEQKLHLINNKYENGYHIVKKGDTLVEEGLRLSDCKTGIWKYYYPNGNLELMVEYACNENGRSDYAGVYNEYFENGKIKLKGRYKLDASDSIECISCFNQFESLKKVAFAMPNTSLKAGEWTEFHENGQPKAIGKYYRGVHETYNMLWLEYDSITHRKSGVSTSGTEYLKHNDWKYYDENGKLRKTEFYVKGILVGEELEVNESQNILLHYESQD